MQPRSLPIPLCTVSGRIVVCSYLGQYPGPAECWRLGPQATRPGGIALPRPPCRCSRARLAGGASACAARRAGAPSRVLVGRAGGDRSRCRERRTTCSARRRRRPAAKPRPHPRCRWRPPAAPAAALVGASRRGVAAHLLAFSGDGRRPMPLRCA